MDEEATVAEAVEAQDRPIQWWFFVFAFLAQVTFTFAFLQAYDLIDRAQPDIDAARFAYIMVFALAAGVAGMVWWMLHEDGMRILAWGAGFGLPAAAMLAIVAQDSYAEWLGLILLLYGLSAALVATVITLVVVGLAADWQRADRAAAGITIASAVAFAGATMYHLATLTRQAELSRAAHEAPGVEVVTLLAAVAASILWVRRRRTG